MAPASSPTSARRSPPRRIALRADIDALPIREQTGLDFASRTDGVSHACGHDVHTTALIGAALALRSIEDRLVAAGIGARLVFQPAEEVMPGGAEDVVAQDGLVGVDRIFALHCDPALDVGQVGLRVGAITAAADQVEVTLSGRGGHTSRPHLTQDLTYALAKVVTDVPGVLSRRLDPRAGAALVWGSVHSGGAYNVIPAIGKVGGTLRMLDASVWEGVERLLEEVVHAVVAPYGVQAEVPITKGVPPVVNDAACIDSLTAAVAGAGAHVAPTPQSLGGEDFAWYLTHVPGAMARLGTRTAGRSDLRPAPGRPRHRRGRDHGGSPHPGGSGLHLRCLGRRLSGSGRGCSPGCGRGSVTLPGRCR